jgi:ParB-like chromosome segregation protein Spo0J
MQLKRFAIPDLIEAEYNPRVKLTERDDEYQDLKYSIDNFGYITPIVVNTNNIVIGGHQRLSVLKSLGYTEIDCVVLDLDENDSRLLNVALNKIDGEWDYGELGELLRQMKAENADMKLTGFSPEEIDGILGSIDYKDDVEPHEDSEDAESDPAGKVECRIGEFKFTITQSEFEKIVIPIKLGVGSQKQVIEGELSRRLLCSK